LLLVPALLAGCGDDSATETRTGQATATTAGPSPTRTTSTSAAATSAATRDFAGELTSTDGYKYAITLSVASQPAATKADECPPATPAVAGTSTYPVSLTVRNMAADKPAPFPPLRVELTSGGAVAPQQVLVRAPAGTCTFTPRVTSLGAGESVTFRGTSPPIATAAAPGSVGKIEVSVSETRFSVAAPMP
jgi:hypothetical protein